RAALLSPAPGGAGIERSHRKPAGEGRKRALSFGLAASRTADINALTFAGQRLGAPVSSSQERTARSFVERHGFGNDEAFRAAARADKWIEEHGLEVVRLSFPDQHGILRGKTVVANEAAAVMRNGCSITTTLLAKDTAHKTVFPVFTPGGGGFGMAEMEGAGD